MSAWDAAEHVQGRLATSGQALNHGFIILGGLIALGTGFLRRRRNVK